jgi:hypothetical protein
MSLKCGRLYYAHLLCTRPYHWVLRLWDSFVTSYLGAGNLLEYNHCCLPLWILCYCWKVSSPPSLECGVVGVVQGFCRCDPRLQIRQYYVKYNIVQHFPPIRTSYTLPTQIFRRSPSVGSHGRKVSKWGLQHST